MFADNPGVDGCYIDSVSAWCYGVLNCRRDQWPANTYPFTYEPGSLKVAAAGRFAMVKYLRALQQRYHPKGKAVFTNIHVNLEAFPLYLVSDVPGIESSLFNDEDSVFFYRASSCRKPLLMMDFINLHGLDKRPVAEAFHLNAAQWGAFPSTGRFVERAYREYGDVTHAFLPAIQEISAAGWQPVPLAEGARVERFGERDAVSFTVRAPKEGVLEALRIAPEALAALGTNLVAFDAVWLSPLPLQRDKEGWTLRFTSGAGPLRIVRVMPRSGVPAWLLARAHAHALNATRVQGEHGVAPELRALEAALRPEARGRRQASAGNLQSAIANLQSRRRQAVLKARAAIKNPEGDLFDQSRSREISQAEGALAALAVFLTGADFSIEGSRLAPAGQDVKVAAHAAKGNAGKAFLVSLKPVEGALILPDLDAWQVRTTAGLPEDALSLRGTQPRVVGAVAEFAVAVGSEQPWPVRRCMEVRFAPAVTLQVKPAGATAEGRAYTVSVQRVGPASKVILRPHLAPPAPVEPATAEVEGVDGVTFRVRAVLDGVPRTLAVSATDAAGSELGRAEAPPYWDEAPLPEGNLALARLGVRATTDSSHSDYSPAPLTDGVLDPANLHWTQQAWASADSSQPHWVQIDLARPATVREVRLYWALDNGEVHTSQQYTVVAVTPDGRREVAKVEGQPASTTSRHTFAPVQAKAIRIEQPAGGGPTGRPGIMWVREVCVAP